MVFLGSVNGHWCVCVITLTYTYERVIVTKERGRLERLILEKVGVPDEPPSVGLPSQSTPLEQV